MSIREQYKQAYRAMRLLKSWRVNMGNYNVMEIVAADQEVFKVMPKGMRVEAYYSYSHRHDLFHGWVMFCWHEELNMALNGKKFRKGYAAKKKFSCYGIGTYDHDKFYPTLT